MRVRLNLHTVSLEALTYSAFSGRIVSVICKCGANAHSRCIDV